MTNTTCVTASPRTGCARGITSTSVRSYLRSTESENGAGKEEATTESSDALPVDDKEVVLAEAERVHILQAYEGTTRNKLRTAKLLGIGLNTLRRKLASYGVD